MLGSNDEPVSNPSSDNHHEENEVGRLQTQGDATEPSSAETCPIVGIGASAGGLDAFTQLVNNLSPTTGMGFVLVQHLDPSHESMLADLLASHTTMPVQEATQGMKVEANQIYIIPPNTKMSIHNCVLELSPRSEERKRHLPIDYFLTSLAADLGSRSIGVILSGAASDGTLGLEAIKAAGGITFAQDRSAKFDSMPRNAIAAGVVDFVLPPEKIASELAAVTDHSYFGAERVATLEYGPALETIIALVRRRTGVDFSLYKRPTIARRLSRRMLLTHKEKLEDYLALLQERPSEIDALRDDLLITVTQFFRDPDAFDYLTKKVIPQMLKDRNSDQPFRVWVPGCSTGKEVYSLAIVLIECLEQAKLQSIPLQIFGTDVNERAIDEARTGRYPESISSTISPDRLKRFFSKVEDGYQIARFVRELCIFSRQDVTRDPPLSRMDLISCRNLLIYLGALLQRRVLSIFIYALQPAGCLLLGTSESLGPLAEYFSVLNSKNRIFKRNLQTDRPQFETPIRRPQGEMYPALGIASKIDDATVIDRRADRMLLDQYSPSGFLIDEQFRVVKFRGDVGPYLSPPPGDPHLDVLRLVHEDIVISLRAAIDESARSHAMVRRNNIQVHRRDGFREINLVVWPIADPIAAPHYLVLFEEVYQHSIPARVDLPPAAPSAIEQESLTMELSTTRAYMQRLVEELRSVNEEAQSANEELQSTNEELQTAKEELQSSNEELTTTNDEMQGRNLELSHLNDDLLNLLSSMRVPIVMLNSELQIRRYTPAAEAVLRLIPSDVGRPISDLKPRILVPDLDELLRHVIRGGSAVERDVQHEDGRWYSLRVQPYKTAQNFVDGVVIHLLDIDQVKLTLQEVKHARDYAEAIIETMREPLLVLDEKLCIQTANRAFFETFRTSPNDTLKRTIYDLDLGQWKTPQIAKLFESLMYGATSTVHDVEVEGEFARLGARTFQLNARYFDRSRDSGLILLVLEDISDRKRAAEAKYRRLFEAAKDGIVIINADTGEITDVNPYLTELLGIRRSEVVGKPFWEIEALAGLQTTHFALDRLREKSYVRFPEITFRRNSDQRDLDLEVVGNHYNEGQRRVAQFNVRDITERKEFDRQFQQTARLESLGILAGGIAHDFNNLLAGILGNAGLALSDAPPGSSHHNALKDVIHASQRAADLTRQMLAYAGKGSIKVLPLDLSNLVSEISKLVQSSIPKVVSLRLDLAEDLPMVEADTGQMQQVVMNLVINGAEAVPEGRKGSVRVSTRLEELSANYLHHNFPSAELEQGKYVVLEVSDDGSGMDDATRARIFDPFFTTKFTGRGLGLAAVQGIIRAHRSGIKVISSPGKGSAFQIVMPALMNVPRPSNEKPKFNDLRGSGLVLVIDDEEIVLQTTRTILERYGYKVITASNGERGVDEVRKHKNELALVILDLTMPVMGGEEALKQIKAEVHGLKVILSSGYDSSHAIDRFGENAFAGFIHKPSTINDFLEIVKTTLTS